MANLCSTSYRVTGTKKAVMDLCHAIMDLSQNGEKRLELAKLADYYGIEWQKKHIHVRGTILDCGLDTNGDEYILSIETETAWSGCHDLFNAINEILWDELSISYCEIEPGCDLFYVHDEADFFPEECVIDSDGEPFDECW